MAGALGEGIDGTLTKGVTMTKQGEIIVQVKRAVKEQYAWPGGYPLFIVMEDGACLCVECGKNELGQIATSTANRSRDGWGAAGIDVNWEDTSLYCDHCSKQIESAYGEKA